MAKSAYCALALTLLMGCPGSECPLGTTMEGARCVEADTGPRADTNSDAFSLFDAHTDDVGADAFNEPDSGLDGGICSRCPTAMPACLGGERCVQCTADNTTACDDDAPACDTETNTCVECNTSTDCTGDTTPVCDVATHTCVPCTDMDMGACGGVTPACDTNNTCTCTATSCTSATAARCDETTNACAACTEDTDCTNVAAPNNRRCVDIGGARECRQCNVDSEATDCPGGDSCNPTTHRCTGRMRESRATCLTCDADSECTGAAAGTATCAQVNILGVTSNYCLPRVPMPASLCSQPFADKQTSTSASGTTVTYCRHATTTCEAFSHYRTTGDGTCTGVGGTDAACGTTSTPADGYCRLSGVGNRCTIPCGGPDDCPIGFTCNALADALAGRRLCSF